MRKFRICSIYKNKRPGMKALKCVHSGSIYFSFFGQCPQLFYQAVKYLVCLFAQCHWIDVDYCFCSYFILYPAYATTFVTAYLWLPLGISIYHNENAHHKKHIPSEYI